MSALVEPAAIEAAAQGLPAAVLRTPLLPAQWLGEQVDAEVRLKCENLQRPGAFKIRGAYTMIAALEDDARRQGVITYSSGNHAQAVAMAAGLFDAPAHVVMPTTAPDVKVQGTRRLGAEVVFEGTTSIERRRRAEAIADEKGLTIVPPFDHPDIIAGQGTAGREILEDGPDVDAVLVPIGGGGLVSGIAAWIKRRRPACRIIGVEPENADAMRRSVESGERVTLDSTDTIADGLAPVRPGRLTFDHARELVDEFVTVPDDAILESTRRLLRDSRLVVEFSGAATVAALLSRRWRPEGRSTVAVLSGGNLGARLELPEAS